ncbi:two-component sensor histidine kinase [Paractinoplanes toevensis]|uniref:histidine kinase n=2 Tax=Paractinoplanes toevensis TaxID=571911 RepID=A0A919W7Q9_9ACTN|nr:two-component sensor histidine kinase [Actinoplanes toevensis]
MNAEEWERPRPTAEQRRADLWIGLGVVAVAMLNVVVTRSAGVLATERAPGVAEQIAWSIATTLPLAWRRKHPELVAVVVALAFIGGQLRLAQEQQIASGALFAAIYTLGAWGRNRRRSRVLRLGIIAAMFLWLNVAFVMSHDEIMAGRHPGASGELPVIWSFLVFLTIVNVGFFGFGYLMGDAVWQSARRQHRLETQAAELRAAQGVAEERAVIGERVRIARELHDVVAHHVSVMGIQASACRRALDRDPARARNALSTIEEGARTAVDELRRMLGALRAPSGPAEDAVTGVDLDHAADLVESARQAGVRTQFGVYGEPVPVPESVSRAAYRIVQEAVTNTLKHAGAAALDVRIRYLARELEIDVSDDGRGGPATIGGMGLIGMRERVAIHGGTLEYGPRSGGGFRVRARIPYARELASK